LPLKIDADALAFLKSKHDGELMLRTAPRHGCCGGTVILPVLEPGAPDGQQDWPILEYEGVRIHIEPGVVLPAEAVIHIGIDSFMKWHKLWIEGLDAQMQ
jgi:hypothetical protein